MLRAVPPSMLLLSALSLLMASWCVAAADEIHVFKNKNGTRLFTDQKMRREGTTYIGTYGRPTAYSSCGRLTKATLAARGDSYQNLIDRHAAAQGVPPALVRAVMQVESCFERRAVSRVGARGLMQLMPGTAAMLGVRDSFDPAQNIAGGTRYLRMMHDRYPGDWQRVLAAYNAGPGAVDKYKGIPPYRETQGYVKKVMALYQKARTPAPSSGLVTAANP